MLKSGKDLTVVLQALEMSKNIYALWRLQEGGRKREEDKRMRTSHLAGGRWQLAVMMSSPRLEPFGRPLVTLAPAQLIGFRLQSGVERLLDCLPYHLADVRAKPLPLDPNYALKVRAACQSCYIIHRSPFVLVGFVG
jgi:hypothetical protein